MGRCRRGFRAKIICPPSSWPPGNKFSEVAKRPTHAAIAMGCRYKPCTGTCIDGRMAAQRGHHPVRQLEDKGQPKQSGCHRWRHRPRRHLLEVLTPAEQRSEPGPRPQSRQSARQCQYQTSLRGCGWVTYPDKSSHGSNQRRRRDKKRQSRQHATTHTQHIVSKLMRRKDPQHTCRERNTQKQPMPIFQDPLPGPEIQVLGKRPRLWSKLYCMRAPMQSVVKIVARKSRACSQ